MKIKSVVIENYKIFKHFEIDFTCDGVPLPLIVIAGTNGSGKSTLFNAMHFNATDPSFKAAVQMEFDDAERGEIVYYPIFDDQVARTKKILVDYIDKLVYEEDMKSSEAYARVQSMLNDIFDGFQMQVELGGLSASREIYFKAPDGGKIPIESLSRGEQQIITKAFSLYLSGIKHSILLIDEPETSLHPSWQSKIGPIYQRFAEENDNQIILSTHSPQIVASVRREQVRVLLKDDDGSIRVISDFSGSYGWRIDRILLEIFGVQQLRVQAVENELQRLNEMLEQGDGDTPEFQEKLSALEDLLGYADPDLALLRLEAEEQRMEKEEGYTGEAEPEDA